MRETEMHIRASAQEVIKLKEELKHRGYIDKGVKIQHDMIFNDDCFKEG